MLHSLDIFLRSLAHEDRAQSLLRLTVASFALVALFTEAYFEADGSRIRAWAKTAIAGVLAVLAVCAYTQMFQLGIPHFVHRSEVFHYYMGSKYFRELGYERLYVCTAVAESELGFASDVRARKMRDLHQNVLVSGSTALDDPSACKQHFSPERWVHFSQDVGLFHSISEPSYWHVVQSDHGYNATPGWGLFGHGIASFVPATLTALRWLAAIDVVLLAGTFAMLLWGFGSRVAWIGLVFWGTQATSTIYWTGGSFLRQEWLFLLITGVALLRRKRPLWAGVAIGVACISRGFPAAFLLGPIVVAGVTWLRDRKLSPLDVRLFGGVAIALGTLVPLSIAVMGADAWPSFAVHIAMHDGTPTTNRMGFRNVVAHSAEGRMQRAIEPHEDDALAHWKDMRRETGARRRWITYAGIALTFALLLAACTRLRSRWLALCLGCVVPTFALGLTCYYYSFFLLTAPLTRARRPLEVALLLASILTNISVLKLPFYDDRYVAMTIVYCVLSTFAVALFLPRDLLRRPFAMRRGA